MIERAEIGKKRVDWYIASIIAKRNENLEFMWELFKKKEDIKLLIEIVEEMKLLSFGQHQALPWCRESFPKLDVLMKKYETTEILKKFNNMVDEI